MITYQIILPVVTSESTNPTNLKMAGFCGELQKWVGANIKLCRILSACLLVVAIALIIAGAVVVSQNKGNYLLGFESFDQYTDRQE